MGEDALVADGTDATATHDLEAAMARKCVFTGKRPNVGFKISHSHRKSKRRQLPNIQTKRIWWAEGDRYLRLRLSTSAIRTIDRKGLQAFADECGVDLSRF